MSSLKESLLFFHFVQNKKTHIKISRSSSRCMSPLSSSSPLPLLSLLFIFYLSLLVSYPFPDLLPFPVTPSVRLITHPASLYFHFHSSATLTTHFKNSCFQFLFSSLPCFTSPLQCLLSFPFITALPFSTHFTDPCFHFLFSSPPLPHLPSPAHITTPLHSNPPSSFPLAFQSSMINWS